MTVSTHPAPGPTSEPRSTWTVRRVLAIIAAAVFLLVGTAALIGGAALHFADSNLRDDQGYFTGSTDAWDSPGYAVRSDIAVLQQDSGMVDLPPWVLGRVQVTVEPATQNGAFVGIARTSAVDRYLRGVAHSTIDDAVVGHHDPMTSRSRFVDGISPPVAPADATFWVVSSSGPGVQTIAWAPEVGSWTLVVMNGEGTTPVAADVTVGAKVPVLDELGTALLVTGFVVVALSGIGLWLALGAERGTGRPKDLSDRDLRP